jgi:hypothetical protein
MNGLNGRKFDNPAAETPIAAATVGPAQHSAEPNAAVIAPPAEATNLPVILSLNQELLFASPAPS